MKTRLAISLVTAVLIIVGIALVPRPTPASADAPAANAAQELSLITATPEEGFDLAVSLSRLGVTRTQPDREVLHTLRPEYANDADALIASSHVVAVHFQTVAAANNYWRD